MKEYMLKGKMALSLMTVASILVFMTGIATAKTTARDEKKLKSEITLLDKDASLPRGEKVVMDRLSKEFNVTGDQIKALRDKKLGYGDIAAVYSMADKMSGGITDDNVNKVLSLREGNKGWIVIAKSLDVDLGSVAKKVGGIEKDAHKDIKKASAETGTAGGGAGGGKSDRSGRMGGGGY